MSIYIYMLDMCTCKKKVHTCIYTYICKHLWISGKTHDTDFYTKERERKRSFLNLYICNLYMDTCLMYTYLHTSTIFTGNSYMCILNTYIRLIHTDVSYTHMCPKHCMYVCTWANTHTHSKSLHRKTMLVINAHSGASYVHWWRETLRHVGRPRVSWREFSIRIWRVWVLRNGLVWHGWRSCLFVCVLMWTIHVSLWVLRDDGLIWHCWQSWIIIVGFVYVLFGVHVNSESES
jgi:hypothetical protein